MNAYPNRIAFVLSSLLLGLTGSSCTAGVDGPESQDAVPAPPLLDKELAHEAMQTVFTNIYGGDAIRDMPRIAPDALLSVEKIRNGATIDYDDGPGNGVVFIASVVPEGISVCSAQVINRWFLLTAAHCVTRGFPSGANTVSVGFTNRAGNVVSVYQGDAFAGVQPDWRRSDKDTGLIFLANGMTTCHGTRSECSSGQPDVPENAVFQYFVPGSTPATAVNYWITGYGQVSDTSGDGIGVLRRGTMAKLAANFTDSNQGFTFLMRWTSGSQARPCSGDSGSPLVVPLATERLLYTGIGSQVSNNGCNATSGLVSYSGLSEAQFTWVGTQIIGVRDQLGLTFDCANGTDPVGLTVFHCDNDGTLH